MRPHLTDGRVTRQKVCQPLAPSVSAACSCSEPVDSMTGTNSRATNGKVTKSVASTIPGTAKMILISCSFSHCPKWPCNPKSSTYINPATTGETEKGKSINVFSSDLPRKLNLAIAHADARPKSRFSGSLIVASSIVSLIAASEYGSLSASKATVNGLLYDWA